MKITLYCILFLGCFQVAAQNSYFLYGLDYVDPKIKYFEVQYDTNTTVYELYDPVNDSVTFEYMIKPEFQDLFSRFPDSLSVDTSHFHIVDTIFFQKELLYTLKWYDAAKSLKITYLDGDLKWELNKQNELIFKRFVPQTSKYFIGNCRWGDCGLLRTDWNSEYHIKTRFKGKKKVRSLAGEKAYMFEFVYRSDLPKLKWKSVVYFDLDTHMPVAMIVQKLAWKYDKGERYLGVDTKHYVKKEF
jgi:hypothetical protein